MNMGAVIAGRQNRYMRRFEAAGATSPANARTLEELGCRHSLVFKRLVSARVFVEANDGQYYLDITKASAFRARRRTVVLVAITIAVAVVVVLMLTR